MYHYFPLQFVITWMQVTGIFVNETGSTYLANIPRSCNLSTADITSWIVR